MVGTAWGSLLHQRPPKQRSRCQCSSESPAPALRCHPALDVSSFSSVSTPRVCRAAFNCSNSASCFAFTSLAFSV
uniref:Uncharacterized protein n=1 Tax=Myoviridae sp. ctjz83 TaxID=2826083 RepID=A0A8D9UHF8_9CAUD|nr:MAG TPA: hypothetical protein [Myoviridae sp. ctjz83]